MIKTLSHYIIALTVIFTIALASAMPRFHHQTLPSAKPTAWQSNPNALTMGSYRKKTPTHASSPTHTITRHEMRDMPASITSESNSQKKKKQFTDILLPIILAENEQINNDRYRLLTLLEQPQTRTLSLTDQRWLLQLGNQYQIQGDLLKDKKAQEKLKLRIDIIPVDMALSQAAIESAWGTSRFAQEGRNLFGHWTYDANKGLTPKKRDQGKKHFVRQFDSLRESVHEYMMNLNTHKAYRKVRSLRHKARTTQQPITGTLLAQGLEKYSAQGDAYITLVQSVIRVNKMEQFNHSRLATDVAAL
jgi:Bax protein